LWFEEIWRTR